MTVSTLSPAGRKDDTGKLRFDLLSIPALRGLCQVLGFGAGKYDPWNWRRGIVYSRIYAATLRHLTAWWWREDDDAETGLNHLKHALCELMFLVDFVESRRDDLDDRPGLAAQPEKEKGLQVLPASPSDAVCDDPDCMPCSTKRLRDQ